MQKNNLDGQQKKRAREILRRLKKYYTKHDEDFTLWKTPLELLIATVLSAQCTDKKVNQATKPLFKKYHSANDYAKATLPALEKEIYSLGFYHSKARYLQSIGKMLGEKYDGKVPASLEELISLPGVSYKTAYLVLAKAFHQYVGIAVDTHVKRLAPRLGFTSHHVPNNIARDLEVLYSPKDYLDVNEFFILHGRKVCKSKPMCAICPLRNICPSAKIFMKKS